MESQPRHSAPGERELVPFETDSDLWPYPRAQTQVTESEQSDSDEIIELDFEDTSALSDMDTFTRVLQNGKKHTKAGGRGVNGTNGAGSVSEKVRGRKKGKKERDAEQLRIREEIENSWDVPGPSMLVQQVYEGVGVVSGPASPSPCPSPVPVQTPPSPERVLPVPKTATMNHVNGVTPKRKERKDEVTKGAAINSDAVRGSIVAAVSTQVPAPTSMERNEFVREVLTLIHVCPFFPPLGLRILKLTAGFSD
jgi:hypothetical protein